MQGTNHTTTNLKVNYELQGILEDCADPFMQFDQDRVSDFNGSNYIEHSLVLQYGGSIGILLLLGFSLLGAFSLLLMG
jgi:hypothetical protein